MPTHVLRIACPDEPGLIHKISGVLFRQGCNIISNHEFVDRETSRFFMRSAYTGTADPREIVREVQALLPPGSSAAVADLGKRRVVLLATKEPHCLGDLLLRHAYHEIPAQIEAVAANHATLEPLARQFGIPFHCVDHEKMTRHEHEEEVLRIVDTYQPEYLVLAKYMRILTPAFVARYAGRIINIHHSFLPAFIGANPYRQAFERGVKLIGATAHFVTDGLDTGPIIAQDVIHIDHSYQARDMAQAGRDVERMVLAKALKLVLEERVFMCGNRTVVFSAG